MGLRDEGVDASSVVMTPLPTCARHQWRSLLGNEQTWIQEPSGKSNSAVSQMHTWGGCAPAP